MPACVKCGANYVPGDAFCAKCGHNLKEEASEQSAPPSERFPAVAQSCSVALREFSKIPLVGLKVSAGLAVAGVILFLFPWVDLIVTKVSGLDILMNAKKVNLGAVESLMLLVIPVACIFTSWTYFRFLQSQIDLNNAKKSMLIAGGISFLVFLAIYLVTRQQMNEAASALKEFRQFMPFMPSISFTFWFYLEFLVLLGIPVGVLYENRSR